MAKELVVYWRVASDSNSALVIGDLDFPDSRGGVRWYFCMVFCAP